MWTAIQPIDQRAQVFSKQSKLDRGVNVLMGRHRDTPLVTFVLEAGYKVVMASRRSAGHPRPSGNTSATSCRHCRGS